MALGRVLLGAGLLACFAVAVFWRSHACLRETADRLRLVERSARLGHLAFATQQYGVLETELGPALSAVAGASNAAPSFAFARWLPAHREEAARLRAALSARKERGAALLALDGKIATGQAGAALIELRALAQPFPDDPWIPFLTARAHVALGDRTSAQRALEEARRLAPNHPSSLRCASVSSRARSLLAILGLLIASALWTAITFRELAYRPHGDWDQYLTFFEIQRRAIQVDGVFPDWNPYLLGGIPGAAHPQFNCTSPFFLPLLFLDLLPGTAVYFGLHYATGVLGMFALLRALGRSVATSAVTALCFGFCFAPFVSGGVVNRMSGSLLPWFWWSRLRKKPANSLLAQALVIGLLFLEGGFYAVLGAGISAGLLGLASGSAPRILADWLRSFCALLLGAALAAVRLLPTVELYLRYPRQTEAYAAAPWWRPEAWADLPAALGALLQSPFLGRRDVLFQQPIFVGIDLGLGVAAVLLFSCAVCARRWFVWSCAGLLLVLCLGAASPLNLWSLLKRVPGLWSFDLPMSLVFLAVIPLCLLIAETLDWTTRRWGLAERSAAVAIAAFGVFAIAVPQAIQQLPLLASRPSMTLPERSRESFHQTSGQRMQMLPSVLRNQGVLDAYEEVIRSRLVVSAKPGVPSFRTEPNAQSCELVSEQAGLLRFRITAGTAFDLIVNQNYAPGWRAHWQGARLEVRPKEGLLSLRVPANQDGLLELHYVSGLRQLGQWISLGAIALFAKLWLTRGQRSQSPEHHCSKLRKWLGAVPEREQNT